MLHTFGMHTCMNTYIVPAYTRAANVFCSICLTDSLNDDLPFIHFIHFIVETSRPPATLRCRGDEDL